MGNKGSGELSQPSGRNGPAPRGVPVRADGSPSCQPLRLAPRGLPDAPLSPISPSAIRKWSSLPLESMAPASECPRQPCVHVPMAAGPAHGSLALRPVLLVTDMFSFTPPQPPRCPPNTPGLCTHRFGSWNTVPVTAGRLHVSPPPDVHSEVTFSARSLSARSKSQHPPQRPDLAGPTLFSHCL